MRRWQAVVFDMDDTLYPERAYVLSGFRAVAAWVEERAGIPATEGFGELRDLFEQGVHGDTFDRWLARHDLSPEEMVPELIQVYRDHEPTLTPYPEVPGVLDALRKRYRLGLVSDGYLAVQQRKLAALGLARCFDAVVFSDTWGRACWKPHTRPYHEVLCRLEVPGEDAVYVGDNPSKDFTGAHAMGMKTVRVRRPEGVYRELEPTCPEERAMVEVGGVGEVEGVLGGLWTKDEGP